MVGYHPYDFNDYNGRCGPVVAMTDENPDSVYKLVVLWGLSPHPVSGRAGMVDNFDLESKTKVYGFESLRPDHVVSSVSRQKALGG